MAIKQRRISWLLHIYYFPTAHRPVIYLLQFDQLFHHSKSSKYFITLHRKIVWQLQIAYLEIFRRFTWLLRKAQFFGYCASYNYFPTAHLPIIYLLQIDQLFHHFKSSKYLITVHTKIEWQLQIAYLEKLRQFIRLLRKAQYFGYSAPYNFLLLRIINLIC